MRECCLHSPGDRGLGHLSPECSPMGDSLPGEDEKREGPGGETERSPSAQQVPSRSPAAVTTQRPSDPSDNDTRPLIQRRKLEMKKCHLADDTEGEGLSKSRGCVLGVQGALPCCFRVLRGPSATGPVVGPKGASSGLPGGLTGTSIQGHRLPRPRALGPCTADGPELRLFAFHFAEQIWPPSGTTAWGTRGHGQLLSMTLRLPRWNKEVLAELGNPVLLTLSYPLPQDPSFPVRTPGLQSGSQPWRPPSEHLPATSP